MTALMFNAISTATVATAHNHTGVLSGIKYNAAKTAPTIAPAFIMIRPSQCFMVAVY